MNCVETPYCRRVAYYETDKMAIVHHSNYIRWFEEARTAYMCQNGESYADLEKKGFLMPVVSVNCRYRSPVGFDDEVEIYTRLVSFNGARMKFEYKIYTDGGNRLVVTGDSEHCFIDAETRRPLNMKKANAEFYEKCTLMLGEKQN